MPEAESIPALKRWFKVFTHSLPYLVLGLVIVGWAMYEQHVIVWENGGCELSSAEGFEFPVVATVYKFLLAKYAPMPSSDVVAVAIDSDLGVVQQNVCAGRGFMAALLKSVANKHAEVIAIDKFYSKDACAGEDPPPADNADKHEAPAPRTPTADLVNTVNRLPIPVVIGRSTNPTEKETSGTCLRETEPLPLVPDTQLGLTRVNQDVLQLPLLWQVLPPEKNIKATAHDNPSESAESSSETLPPGENTATSAKSFAVVAAETFDQATAQTAGKPAWRSDQIDQLIQGGQQPYANVSREIETYHATDILCSTLDLDAKQQWGLDKPGICGRTKQVEDLRGKLVVIGAESGSDRPVVLGEGTYGFQLQARYIAALLTGSYLRPLPVLSELMLLFVYYVIAELVLPAKAVRDKAASKEPAKALFSIEYLFYWKLGFLAIALLCIFAGTLIFHRLPPLELLTGMVLISIPHLLVEGWEVLNEPAEHSHKGSRT